jgi:hypothetical protein
MSTPVDEFDLDIRVGDGGQLDGPYAVTKTTDGDLCLESHCPTCGCCRPLTESCF